MAVLLIGQKYLVEHSIIDDNADYKKITPAIIIAQDLDLKPLLGSDMVDKLKNDITAFVNNATPIPALYKTLLEDYVQPALVHFTLARCTPTFKFKYASKGIMIKTSENSQQAESIDIAKLSDEWKNTAQEYAKYMKDYLNWNAASYPEYGAISGSTYKVYPRQEVFEVPIFLPPTRTGRFTDPASYYRVTRLENE